MRASDHSTMSRTFAVIELAFTAVFAVEVVVALLAYQFPAFFHSAWNIFDSVIVLVSVISYVEDDVPAFNPLRIIRVFRAVKVMYVCMCVCVFVCMDTRMCLILCLPHHPRLSRCQGDPS